MKENNHKKHIGYYDIPNAKTPVDTLTVGDLQMEAQERMINYFEKVSVEFRQEKDIIYYE